MTDKIKSFKHKTIISCAVLALVAASVFTLLRTKQAQAVCDNPIGTAISLGVWVVDGLNYIQSFDGGIQDFISVDIQVGQDETQQRIEEFDENTREGMGEWWNDDFKPSLHSMTAQISTAKIDETRNRLSMQDAENQTEFMKMQKEGEVEARRRLTPSENQACRMDTAGPTLGKRLTTVKEISRGSANDAVNESIAAAGTPESEGFLAVLRDKWDKLRTTYCDSLMYGGGFCPGDGPMKNADISVGSSILWGEKMSFDMDLPANQELFQDIKRNFIEQNPAEPILEVTMETPDAIADFNEMRSNAARKQSIHAVMGRIMAMRASGPPGDPAPEIQSLRISAGVDPAMASLTPSAYETMHALTKDAVMRKDFVKEIINNPAALLKDTVATKSLHIQQVNLMYSRMEELSLMLAGEFARDMQDNEPGNASSEALTGP